MKYKSVFDIIGPIMVGPSSSHTAGAAKIGLFSRQLFGNKPKNITITLYGSFAKTYKGHATDVALLGGLLNFTPCDERIPNAKQLIKDEGIDVTFIESDEEHIHPNTVKLELSDETRGLSVVGISIGGGQMQIIEIDGFKFKPAGKKHFIFTIIDNSKSKMLINGIKDTINKHNIVINSSDISCNSIENNVGLLIRLESKKTYDLINELKTLDGIKLIRFIMEGDE